MIAAGKANKRGQVMAEINITPFTDVVLVILIIFMVSASFMGAQNALDVNLPSAKNAENLKQKQNVEVTVTRDGNALLNGNRMSLSDMPAALRDENGKKPVDMVVVRADRQVPYAKVVQVMDAVKQAGIQNIAFPTQTDSSPNK